MRNFKPLPPPCAAEPDQCVQNSTGECIERHVLPGSFGLRVFCVFRGSIGSFEDQTLLAEAEILIDRLTYPVGVRLGRHSWE